MLFAYDRQSLRKFDVDGRLHVASCRISKANVCPYLGREIPGYAELGLEPDTVYRLYRDPAELAAAAPSFANLQLLMAHVPVSADEPMIELTVGAIGSDAHFDAPYLVASLAVWTAEAIALIETKAQAQLSSSYRYRPDMTPGQTPDGVAFDGVMRDIIGNHVALVEEGRAGPDVVVNDSLHTEAVPMKFPKLLAALKAMLKPDADLVAADAAIVAVMADKKPASTRFLRIAAALKPFMANAAADFSPLAADAAVDAEMCAAEDAEKDDDEEDDPDRPGFKRKKKAADASAPVEPGPQTGEVGKALDAAIKSGAVVSKADAQAMADAAATDAVARVNTLHAAREAVKPLVGLVAMDTAEAVYRFALDHAKVDHKAVKELSALASLVDMAKRAAGAAPAKPAGITADSASAVSEAIPGLSRIAHA